jgi:predicted DNA-binding ribbon-helix-helix protein
MINDEEKRDKPVLLRFKPSVWRSLRMMAAERDITAAKLINTELEKIINKHKKSVDNN